MDIPTKNLAKYVREKGINISKMARETNIPYVSLYDSLANESRDRDLRAGEFLAVCSFLGVTPEELFQAEEAE